MNKRVVCNFQINRPKEINFHFMKSNFKNQDELLRIIQILWFLWRTYWFLTFQRLKESIEKNFELFFSKNLNPTINLILQKKILRASVKQLECKRVNHSSFQVQKWPFQVSDIWFFKKLNKSYNFLFFFWLNPIFLIFWHC